MCLCCILQAIALVDLDPDAARGDLLEQLSGLARAPEARRLGRNSLGVELQADVAARTRELLLADPSGRDLVSEMTTGDCLATDYRELLARHGQQSAQLVMLHPP